MFKREQGFEDVATRLRRRGDLDESDGDELSLTQGAHLRAEPTCDELPGVTFFIDATINYTAEARTKRSTGDSGADLALKL